MPETLALTAPETFPSVTTWSIQQMFINVAAPFLRVVVVSNIGTVFDWIYQPGPTLTEAQVRTTLSQINQGKFMTVQGKSLQHAIFDLMVAQGVKLGAVTGTPD